MAAIQLYALTLLSSSGAIACWTPVSKITDPNENENPATTAAAPITTTGACAASSTLCTAVSAKIGATTTQGRDGRTRRPTSAPTSAPIPSPVTTVAHALAPPSECFEMYGPNTKNGAYVIRK